VLYGLTRRLAPTRRLFFVLAVLVALVAPVECGFKSVSREQVVFSLDLHTISVGILVLLLGMELVDKIQFRDELTLARDLQADLVPKVPPSVPGFQLGAFNQIANTVGGDVYDFEALPDGRLAILFGDASGHGMAAGLVMAVTHSAFRTQLEVDPSPEAVVRTVNRGLCRTGSCRLSGPRAFFAGAFFLIEPDGAFRAIVAGHPFVLRVAADGSVAERIGKGAYPLGIKPDGVWAVESGRLGPGETLVFHSDGLFEARNAADVEFGDGRIEAVIRRRAGAGPQELVGALAAELADFMGRHRAEDDVSIAAVRLA
jgi:sigma-B regulation protein RsbU (phosphoserine phosphatase)